MSDDVLSKPAPVGVVCPNPQCRSMAPHEVIEYRPGDPASWRLVCRSCQRDFNHWDGVTEAILKLMFGANWKNYL